MPWTPQVLVVNCGEPMMLPAEPCATKTKGQGGITLSQGSWLKDRNVQGRAATRAHGIQGIWGWGSSCHWLFQCPWGLSIILRCFLYDPHSFLCLCILFHHLAKFFFQIAKYILRNIFKLFYSFERHRDFLSVALLLTWSQQPGLEKPQTRSPEFYLGLPHGVRIQAPG